VKNLEKRLQAWENAAALAKDGPLGYSWLSSASTYLDWVVPALFDSTGVMAFTDAGEYADESNCAAEKEGSMKRPEEDYAGKFHVMVVPLSENVVEETREDTEGLLSLGDLLRVNPDVCQDEQAREYLEGVFEAEYPYEANQAIPGKVTVSELKKMSQRMEENDAQELYAEEEVVPVIDSPVCDEHGG